MNDSAWLAVPFGFLIWAWLAPKKAQWRPIGGLFKEDRKTGEVSLLLWKKSKKKRR